MPDREKVVNALECCIDGMLCAECGYEGLDRCFDKVLLADALSLLKEQEAKPLRCKKCNYHRDDGWCNEHGREVQESDYCSFGAWESR